MGHHQKPFMKRIMFGVIWVFIVRPWSSAFALESPSETYAEGSGVLGYDLVQPSSYRAAQGLRSFILSKLPKVSLPPKAPDPPMILSKEVLKSQLTPEEWRSLRAFTGEWFRAIRSCKIYPPDVFKSLIRCDQSFETACVLSDGIESALKKLPKTEHTVYRAVRDVELKDVKRFLEEKEAKIPIGLAPDNRPGVASSTWNIDIAKRYAFHEKKGDVFNIIFEIDQKSGVSIENVSYIYAHENEILLPAAQYEILSIGRVEDVDSLLLVRLREVAPKALAPSK